VCREQRVKTRLYFVNKADKAVILMGPVARDLDDRKLSSQMKLCCRDCDGLLFVMMKKKKEEEEQ